MSKSYLLIVLLALFASAANAMYDASDDVLELTADNWGAHVTGGEQSMLVEFYAPWCGHCKQLAPLWKETATVLKGFVGVGAVDVPANEDVIGNNNLADVVTGFPTILFYGADGGAPVEFNGERSVKSLVTFAFKQAKDLIKVRLDGGSGGDNDASAKNKPTEPKKEAPKEAKKEEQAADDAGASIELTGDNFDELVLQSDDVWMVEFFAPWCGHCKRLAPEWTKAAKKLAKVKNLHLGTVDGTVHEALKTKYGIDGYPTIKIFGKDKLTPIAYNGGRTAKDIVAEAREYAKTGGEAPASPFGDDDPDNKVVFFTTAEDFDNTVLASEDFWLLEFYAPWCGHCKKLAPVWRKTAEAAAEHSEHAKVGAVDCTAAESVCNRYGATSYPTLKYLPMGPKEGVEPQQVPGTRDFESFMELVKNECTPAPEVFQITDAEVFEDTCGAASVCVLAFLPHILDSKAKGREAFLAALKSVSIANKSLPVAYMWTEAMQQPKLESSLNVGGAGYPALVAVNVSKKLYSSFAGAFDAANINGFLSRMMKGGESSFPVREIGAIDEVAEWDGKDGQLPEEL